MGEKEDMTNRTLEIHEELLREARAAKSWRDNDFAPWREGMDQWKGRVDKRLLELEEFDGRVITDARGNEETIMAELANVKREVKEDMAKIGGDLEGARQLAGKLPGIESQISSAQTMLTAAAGHVREDARARARWRKLQTPVIAFVTALLMAVTQRFVLPPAAQNDPHALLPGPTPTVNVK